MITRHSLSLSQTMVEQKDVPIAVIGGSGLYHLDNLEVIEEVNPETV
jgi:purine nucleoside phosphorylase